MFPSKVGSIPFLENLAKPNFFRTRNQTENTYGNFIFMNTLQQKNATETQMKPKNSNRNRFNLGKPTAFDLSSTMNPIPPRENIKLAARPSIIYCPLTR